MITHLFMAVGIVGMAAAIFALGFQSARIWIDWQDDKELRAAEARHSHRKTSLPRAGRIPLERLADPEPLPGESWLFAGGWDEGPVGSAEYELLTQTVVQPVSVTGEPPIDTGELLAITDRVESWIAQWTAQGNVDRHTIQAGE